MRAALVRGVAPALLLLLVLAVAPLAHAHDSLVSSTPEAGQVLSTGPAEVSLTFSATIGEEFAQVAVVDATGASYQDGAPSVSGAVVTQAVRQLPPGTDVTVSYRVVSSDGHPIGGTVAFTVAGADDQATGDQPADPANQPADPANPPADQTEQTVAAESDTSTGLALGLAALVAVAVAVALAAVLARRRSRTTSGV